MSVIEIKNLTRDYGLGKGIFNVSFSIEEGEVFGFLGPNGAGKTTTIRHLMGFLSAKEGYCKINGLDCKKDAKSIQRSLGYIPGEISFMSNISAKDYISFIGKYRGMKNLGRAQELIDRFHLDTRGNIKKMSKGMKQKLGIVCAFMDDPKVLLLDEPSSGLDPLMQNEFINLIKEEQNKGKTILMSSHMFEEVERTCQRVGIVKDGKIAVIDSIDSLKNAQIRQYTLSFSNITDANGFAKAGFNVVLAEDLRVTVAVQDNLPTFMADAAKYNPVDLAEINQNLESIFLQYYGGEH